VVCPLSVLSSWQAELVRWCPSLRVLRCHTSDAGERGRRCDELRHTDEYDVALTTYEMLKSPVFSGALHARPWDCVVLDEGHRVKNEFSQQAAAVRSLRRACGLLLTGTLLQNNLHELWSLLNLQYGDVFTTSAAFDAGFRLSGESHRVDPALLERCRAALRPLWLRRSKAEVSLDVPPKTELAVFCPLSQRQTRLYRAALLHNAEVLDAAVAGGGGGGASSRLEMISRVRHLCMSLRLLCAHPLLVLQEELGVSGEAEAEGEDVEALVAASGKLAVLDRLLARLHAAGSRCVIFTQFTSMLDVLEEYVEERGWKYARLDGATCRARRTVDILLFNRPGSDTFLFLASTRAGGLGINLQSADTCILFDSGACYITRRSQPSLTPGRLEPAGGRAGDGASAPHRPDQARACIPPDHRRHGGGAHRGARREEALSGRGGDAAGREPGGGGGGGGQRRSIHRRGAGRRPRLRGRRALSLRGGRGA